MGYIHLYSVGMCDPKGYGFLAILVINGVLIVAILVSYSVWFCTLFLNSACFLKQLSYFLVIIDKTVNKSPSHYL